MQSSIYNNDKEYQKFISTLEEPELSKNACIVLENRYLRRGPDNKPTETIKELFARVAWHLSRPEVKYRGEKGATSFAEELYYAMIDGRIMFNSPTLFNAGTGNGLGLSACYVRVPEDSLNSIMEVCTDLALIQKAGGGVGYNFSKLRPKGSMVTTCAATTDGPLPFIDMYCSTTNAIQQGAKRRGAQMGMLDITHPDVWQFIQAKSDLTRWQNMNVSLLATNEWMNKLVNNPNEYHKVYHEKWGTGYLVRDTVSSEYHPVVWDKPVEELVAQQSADSILTIGQLFYEICRRAWTTGEPGLVFIDRVNEDWMFSTTGINPIEATNPCGEQPLENGGNCTLASINLAEYYNSYTNLINIEKLKLDVRLMQSALDNVVEVNTFPVDIVTEQNLKTRRIGGGIMGWADLLFLMGIPYNSERARELAKDIMRIIEDVSLEVSEQLGKERGSFLDWDKSDYDTPMRNAYRNTIAPTGTISIIADCSGGVEPIFSLAFTREVLQGANGRRVKMFEGNKIFETKLKKFLDSKCSGDAKNLIDDFVKEIIKHAATNGTLKNYMGVPALWDGWKEFIAPFVTTKDISPTDHVLMQAAWQKYVDTAISKTINLNNDATVEDVMEAYKLAYNTRCKGITVYRDGSRDGVAGMAQPMKLDKPQEEPKKEEPAFKDIKWEAPGTTVEAPANVDPEVSNALKVKQVTPMGNLHVTCVLSNDNTPIEIFAQISKAGEQPAADLEAICRLASMYLRESKNFDEVIKQLEHIGSSTLMPSKDGQIKSLPDGLSLALKKIKKVLSKPSTQKIDTNQPVSSEKIHIVSTKNDKLYAQVCPNCNKKLIRAEGCMKCEDPNCGFSKC